MALFPKANLHRQLKLEEFWKKRLYNNQESAVKHDEKKN